MVTLISTIFVMTLNMLLVMTKISPGSRKPS
jgi:hypothetical protein